MPSNDPTARPVMALVITATANRWSIVLPSLLLHSKKLRPAPVPKVALDLRPVEERMPVPEQISTLVSGVELFAADPSLNSDSHGVVAFQPCWLRPTVRLSARRLLFVCSPKDAEARFASNR